MNKLKTYLGTVRYLGGRCLELGGGKIFKINEKNGGVF